MKTIGDLESLDYRELQKLAKSKNIRPSGKGMTKKRLISLLRSSMQGDESGCSEMDSPGNLPLQEVPVETVLPISSPAEEQWNQLNRVDLNESNKENNLRRLTFEIVKGDTNQPPVKGKKPAQKTGRRVKIIGTPTNVRKDEISTPKPPMQVVRTPAATRSTRASNLVSEVRTPTNKTPRGIMKTPATTRTVALRLAASAKKSELTRTQSRIPKLNPKKLPNFASIHQNAFEKMESLVDVEKQRVTRMKQTMSAKLPAVKLFAAKKSPVKKVTIKKTAEVKIIKPTEKTTAVNASTIKKVDTKRSVASSSPKVNRKEVAKQAAMKTKPSKSISTKDEQRTFLKGVRINKRFEMQMRNRGLLSN